jgi:hypothetical protein
MRICRQMQIPLVAVYMDDELDFRLKDGNYIVNLESSHQQGSHWCAFILEQGTAYYFDPFGIFPDEPIHQHLLKNNFEIIMNDKTLQNINSILCGYFCIGLFLFMKMNTGTTYKKFEGYFRLFNYKNTKLNDKVIKDYLTSHSLIKQLTR